MNRTLLLIDPQEDFCNPATGSLYVKNAEHDMRRVAQLIRTHATSFKQVKCTLDSHPIAMHIGNASFWQNSDGSDVAPFTIITPADVKAGLIRPKTMAMRAWGLTYVETLAANGRYPLCAWPDHCIIGSKGASMVDDIFSALQYWSGKKARNVDLIAKGSNPYTEHYSGVEADVPDPKDASTQIDPDLIDALLQADEIVVAGEALSHCVANTVRDVARRFGDPSLVKKFTLLIDGTSPVPGFENLANDFVAEMTALGMRTVTCADFS